MKIKGISLTKKRIVRFAVLVLALSLVLTGTVSALTTGAWFFDVETSNENKVTAGTLDLTIDGKNGENSVGFTVDNMAPGGEIKNVWQLKNIGNTTGYLDLKKMTLTSNENDILEPEAAAGDTTAKGELEFLVDVTLFVDRNGTGAYESGSDELIFQGRVNELNDKAFLKKIQMDSNSEVSIGVEFKWPAQGYYSFMDNRAMGDSFRLDVQFLLSQTTSNI